MINYCSINMGTNLTIFLLLHSKIGRDQKECKLINIGMPHLSCVSILLKSWPALEMSSFSKPSLLTLCFSDDVLSTEYCEEHNYSANAANRLASKLACS